MLYAFYGREQTQPFRVEIIKLLKTLNNIKLREYLSCIKDRKIIEVVEI